MRKSKNSVSTNSLESNQSDTNFSSTVLQWFKKHGRKNLPWQKTISPYRVWLSEIMLQQTQVATAIPYFERFIQYFPDIRSLANASLDEVLHVWSGLGYYSRARHLHQTATVIVKEFGGEFPDALGTLVKLPGIGRSTAAAIRSIAFEKPAAILDGNVKRLLSRYLGIIGPCNTSMTLKTLWERAEQFLPQNQARHYTQALMDLGATVCLRSKPRCEWCPLQSTCYAFRYKMTGELPQKKLSKTLPVKFIHLLIILNKKNKIFLMKRPPVGIWSNLWSLPESTTNDFITHCKNQLQFIVNPLESLPSFRHTFSHFHLDIQPELLLMQNPQPIIMDAKHYIWYDIQQPEAIGLAAPIKKLLANLKQHPLFTTSKEQNESNGILS